MIAMIVNRRDKARITLTIRHACSLPAKSRYVQFHASAVADSPPINASRPLLVLALSSAFSSPCCPTDLLAEIAIIVQAMLVNKSSVHSFILSSTEQQQWQIEKLSIGRCKGK
jgi:hypothetical protein